MKRWIWIWIYKTHYKKRYVLWKSFLYKQQCTKTKLCLFVCVSAKSFCNNTHWCNISL